jgi:hypothetical protein
MNEGVKECVNMHITYSIKAKKEKILRKNQVFTSTMAIKMKIEMEIF